VVGTDESCLALIFDMAFMEKGYVCRRQSV
jgi:hypothetical protein